MRIKLWTNWKREFDTLYTFTERLTILVAEYKESNAKLIKQNKELIELSNRLLELTDGNKKISR